MSLLRHPGTVALDTVYAEDGSVFLADAADGSSLGALGLYVASAGHLAAPVARMLVAAPVVVAPLAQQEVANSIANLHWPLLYTVFWRLIWTPPLAAVRLPHPILSRYPPPTRRSRRDRRAAL